MDINYLYSVLSLYLVQEDENKVIINLTKLDDNIKFSFSNQKNINDITTFNIKYTEMMEENNLREFLCKFKSQILVKDEKYSYDQVNNKGYYLLVLNNGREISFKDFDINEINKIRNLFYNNTDSSKEIILKETNISHEETKQKPVLRLQEQGFASYLTIMLIGFCFIAIFLIVLFVQG